MNWIIIQNEADLEAIDQKSKTQTVLLFKHSTRCNISDIALKRFEHIAELESIPCYYLDILKHRNLSNEVADKYNIHHESPQLLVIQNSECTAELSHLEISKSEILNLIK
jgi:bacillithiol system protein YtxJ